MARKPKNPDRPFISPGMPADFYQRSRSWRPAAQAVALFAWTGPHREQGREGLFPMDAAGFVSGMAHGWSLARVEDALQDLQRRGWLLRDAGWIFLTSALDHEQPWGQRSVQAAVNRLKTAPRESFVWRAFLDTAEEKAPELYAALLPSGPSAIEGVFATHAIAPTIAPTVAPSVGHQVAPTVDPNIPRATGETDRAHDELAGRSQRLMAAPGGVRVRASRPDRQEQQQAGGPTCSSAAQPHGNAPGGQRLETSRSATEGRRA